MRIDPASTLGGYPVLQVRNLVRKLNNRLYWDSKTVQAVLRVGPREATDLLSALEVSGLAKPRHEGPDQGARRHPASPGGQEHRPARRRWADRMTRPTTDDRLVP